MRFPSSIGFILLSIYLILIGLGTIFPALVVPVILTGVLALVAGVLILIGK